MNNVLRYAPGIPINNGKVHTIGNSPQGSLFYGIKTLHAIAEISFDGAHPFSWLTLQSKPEYSPHLTDSNAASIDISWLAIQTALLSGNAYLPAGNYIVGSAIPLPLHLPASPDKNSLSGSLLRFIGDGPRLSRITAGFDWGTGFSLLTCGNPGETRDNNSSFNGNLQGIGLFSSAASWYFGAGKLVVRMDGLTIGSRIRTFDAEATGFYRNVSISGKNTENIRLHTNGGSFGLYIQSANPGASSGLKFDDYRSDGASIAGIGVSSEATLQGVFAGETYLGTSPFGILGERGGCRGISEGVQFDSLHFEFIGNALVSDDNAYENGVYRDQLKCRALSKFKARDFAASWLNYNFWGGPGSRQRRAAIDVSTISMEIDQLVCDSGCWNPNSEQVPPGSAAPMATILLSRPDDGSGGNSISGNVDQWIARSGALPLLRVTGSPYRPLHVRYRLHSTGWDGYLVSCLGSSSSKAGNHHYFQVGDLLEADLTDCDVGGSVPLQRPLGIAMQNGEFSTSANTMGIPVATSGLVKAATGWTESENGIFKKATGIGKQLTIRSQGSGGAAGTFNWTATGGGCSVAPTGTFTVAQGQVTATTVKAHGSGCKGIPTVLTSASTGLSGASLIPTWPSGLVEPATSFSDGVLAGAGLGGDKAANGGNTINLYLAVPPAYLPN